MSLGDDGEHSLYQAKLDNNQRRVLIFTKVVKDAHNCAHELLFVSRSEYLIH